MNRVAKDALVLTICAGLLGAIAPSSRSAPAPAPTPDSGVVRVKSVYDMAETITRIKQDIARKGIKFFDEIDQSNLASGAGIQLRPSTLLVFGNPPLGIQFLTSNPYAGLDWPVRMVVFQDEDGQVWIAYTSFDYIAQRYQIADRGAQFKMASEVAASIASSAAQR